MIDHVLDRSALKLQINSLKQITASNLLYVWKLKNKINFLKKSVGQKRNPNWNYKILELNNQNQKTALPIKTCAIKLKWYLEGNA